MSRLPFEDSSANKLDQLVDVLKYRILDDLHKFPILPRTDVSFLSKFIRAKKYNVEEAQKIIHKYYGMIYRNLNWLEGIHTSEYEVVFTSNCLRILKNRWNDALLLYLSMANWNTEMASCKEVVVATCFILEELLQKQHFQLHGFCGIVDLSGFGFGHVQQLSFQNIKFAIQMALQALPTRLAGIHFVNVPLIFWPILKIFMALLPTKLRSRVRIHDNYASLAESINRELLPQSLGGDLEEDQAWDKETISDLSDRNVCYDGYWKVME